MAPIPDYVPEGLRRPPSSSVLTPCKGAAAQCCAPGQLLSSSQLVKGIASRTSPRRSSAKSMRLSGLPRPSGGKRRKLSLTRRLSVVNKSAGSCKGKEAVSQSVLKLVFLLLWRRMIHRDPLPDIKMVHHFGFLNGHQIDRPQSRAV